MPHLESFVLLLIHGDFCVISLWLSNVSSICFVNGM